LVGTYEIHSKSYDLAFEIHEKLICTDS